MQLRAYQTRFVEECVSALSEHGNTLGVAPTGSGKTVMLSAIVEKMLGSTSGKALILAHRDELIAQNRLTFKRMNPTIPTSIVDQRQKSWEGRVIFGMSPTLSRSKHLSSLPMIDMLVIDEAHHATARSYLKIIEKAKAANPDLKLLGVTATPLRGDKKSLRTVFTNCGAHLSLHELIAEGALVKPRTFVIDVGVQDDLNHVRKIGSEYDMEEVAKIMDRTPIADAVIREWKQKAGSRQTIVFCSTIKHAQHMTEAFTDAGIKAAYVSGKTPLRERQEILTALKYHDIQVLVNVNVATEGFDEPSLSCVVLLRPSSQKNTLIQMIGRGLRPFKDEKRGLIKEDCIILDFGTSLRTHGDLEQEVELKPVSLPGMNEAPLKACPTCRAKIPIATLKCPFCGYVFKGPDVKTLSDFRLREIDIINRLKYEWEDLFNQGNAYIATGFKVWCGVFLKREAWHAIGGKGNTLTLIAKGTQEQAFKSAEAWLKKQGGSKRKAPDWHGLPATDKQLRALPSNVTAGGNLTRYQASCWLSYLWNHQKIINVITDEAA